MKAIVVFPGNHLIKRVVVKVSFFILGRALQSASMFDPTIRKELSPWEDGYTIKMEVLPKGPVMGWRKHKGTLKYVGGSISNANLEIRFKNLTSAFLLMTPQVGVAQGFAENRMSVKGDLSHSIVFVRILNVVISYLYPDFIANRLLKEIPPLPYRKYYRRAYLYLIGIPFGK